jgi:hypothetical protein
MPSRRIRLLLLLLLLLPMSAAAQDGIHHCVGPDGNPLFTDQPCAALGATPVADAPAARPGVGVTTGLLQEPSAPTPVLCASSVAELRQSVLEAFSRRDPNRLAGLMLWGGYGHEAVVADIRSMNELMQRPLLDVDETSTEDIAPAPSRSSDVGDLEHSLNPASTAAPAVAPAPPAGNRQIVVRTAASDGSGVARETHFGVVRRSGCLWLRNSG